MRSRRVLLVWIILWSSLSLTAVTSQGAITLQPVASGLNSPVAIAHAGDSRLFIAEQPGRIVIFDGTQVLSPPFLDISALVSCCGERGLLGLAFHPNYATNGYFYVFYTAAADGALVVARYSRSGNPNVADPGSVQIILTIPHPTYANHNGGQLAFAADGYLYIGTGDGGGGGDPDDNAQNLGVLLGKLLRIDVDGGVPYAIPSTNPFVGTAGARGEIWVWGLRNPWRFSFDRLTDDLFIGDVGQGSREEIDFQPASSGGGENYGWRRMEGTACYVPGSNCNDGTLTLPIIEYDHSAGNCSVTGGYRYRGGQVPGLFGVYVFGDFCSGQIWGASEDGSGAWTISQLLDTALNISTFGEDSAGELYVADLSTGVIHRLVGQWAPVTVTGLTADRASPQPVGTPVTWTATVAGGMAPLQYQFWRRRTSGGGYVVVQPYGSSASYTWTPGPGDAGEHQVAVWVRSAGATAAVDAGGIAAPFSVAPN